MEVFFKKKFISLEMVRSGFNGRHQGKGGRLSDVFSSLMDGMTGRRTCVLCSARHNCGDVERLGNHIRSQGHELTSIRSDNFPGFDSR
jgi:hypothetical protein